MRFRAFVVGIVFSVGAVGAGQSAFATPIRVAVLLSQRHKALIEIKPRDSGAHLAVLGDADGNGRFEHSSQIDFDFLKIKFNGNKPGSWNNDLLIAASDGPLGLWIGGKLRGYFEGYFRVRRYHGRIQVINWVPLEKYLVSVVGGEMNPRWPLEALKAQAVLARSFAVSEVWRAIKDSKQRDKGFDLHTDVGSQLYRGVGSEESEAQLASVRKAVRATRGRVLMTEGEPLKALYFSHSGGQTSSAVEVWGGRETAQTRPYVRQASPECAPGFSPGSWGCEWKQVQLTRAELEEVARQIDPVFERVESVRAVYEPGSKRVSVFILENSTQAVEIPAGILRIGVGTLRLPSTLLERVSWVGDKLIAWSRGYGHGVGMSQYGAYYLAQQKRATFETIINHYIHRVTWMNLRDDADTLATRWNALLRRPLVEQGSSEEEPE